MGLNIILQQKLCDFKVCVIVAPMGKVLGEVEPYIKPESET